MKSRVSAGLLMYRFQEGDLQIFLAHPGGPLYQNKDAGCWTIPKGESPPGEPLQDAAVREFEEETGIQPHGPYLELGSITQKGGKRVYGWAFQDNLSLHSPSGATCLRCSGRPGPDACGVFPKWTGPNFSRCSKGKKS